MSLTSAYDRGMPRLTPERRAMRRDQVLRAAVAYIWMRIVTSRDDQRLTQMVLKLKLAVRNPNRVLRNGARSYAPIGYRGGRHVWRR